MPSRWCRSQSRSICKAARSGKRVSRLAASRTNPGETRTPKRSSPERSQRGESFLRAAETLLRGARGFGHNDFKIELARRAIVRALTQAARGTPQSQTDKRIK